MAITNTHHTQMAPNISFITPTAMVIADAFLNGPVGAQMANIPDRSAYDLQVRDLCNWYFSRIDHCEHTSCIMFICPICDILTTLI